MKKTFQEMHEERRERLLMKVMLSWVKLRFALPLQLFIPEDCFTAFKTVQSMEHLKRAAMISKDDAWLLERNAGLFGIIAKSFMREILPKELYHMHGAPTVMTDRKNRVLDIGLLPPTSTGHSIDVIPCTMYIIEKKELVKKFKNSKDHTNEKQVDIVAMLLRNLDSLLSKDEQELIHVLFDKYKTDSEVIKVRESIIKSKENEEKNIRAIKTVIHGQGERTNLAKLAITLWTIVEHSYKTNPHNVMKIRYGTKGAEPVLDYSRLFVIDYDVDLFLLQRILGPIMSGDIKIKVGENKILFTTTSHEPDNKDEMSNVVTSMIEDENDLDATFNTFVGPVASVNDVRRIMQRFYQENYEWQEHEL